MSKERERFARWLKKQMDDLGLNQNELAQRSGLYASNVSMVLSGEKEPGTNFFIKIAKGLHLPPGYVFEQYATPVPEPLAGSQLLATKISEITGLLVGMGLDSEIALIYEFAEMLLKRQPGRAPAPDKGIRGEITNPQAEDINNILQYLDQAELQNTYDYVRWRLVEQERRRISSGKRREKDAKTGEYKDVIDLIDFMLAIDEATPKQRETFILSLIELYQSRLSQDEQGKDNPGEKHTLAAETHP